MRLLVTIPCSRQLVRKVRVVWTSSGIISEGVSYIPTAHIHVVHRVNLPPSEFPRRQPSLFVNQMNNEHDTLRISLHDFNELEGRSLERIFEHQA